MAEQSTAFKDAFYKFEEEQTGIALMPLSAILEGLVALVHLIVRGKSAPQCVPILGTLAQIGAPFSGTDISCA